MAGEVEEEKKLSHVGRAIPGIVALNPKPSKGFTSKAIDYIEELISMVKENKLAYAFDATKKARFGVLPRYAKNELQIRWYEMRFNMKTGLASQKKLSGSAVEFPRINDTYTGRKQRYVYGTVFDSIAKITGIVKFDLHAEPVEGKDKIEVGGNVKGIFKLGEGRFGSEAVFVPREDGIALEEDDGYLIFFVHDEKTG
ncbi:hypothetical protein CRG98_007596 [Punica granatum]|uniref:carotenoid 9,10-dioxygenase n=1 Tax=Punica granatum TaxID=22663 RepID=A0A2I0KUP2_PUNGR|nr:hypothetical protein CRG98_007596 [Punica granatum]